MKFLDANAISQLITVKDIIEEIESYYLNDKEKDSYVPERLFINDDKNTAILMPSFYENYYAAKVIGIAPENAEKGEATLQGAIVLFDRQRMKPLLFMDARKVTAMRTGAISGVGMKYMSKPKSSTIGVIGTGDQGWSHLEAACAVRAVKKVLIINRSEKRLESFLQQARIIYPQIDFTAAYPKELLVESDIVITTTTSVDPVLPKVDDVDLRGKHFAGSGSFKSHMQEIPNYILDEMDFITVDSYAAFNECKEMSYAKSIGYNESNVLDTKQLVLNGVKKEVQEGVTFFKSVGVAILDVITAKLIYENYLKNN